MHPFNLSSARAYYWYDVLTVCIFCVVLFVHPIFVVDFLMVYSFIFIPSNYRTLHLKGYLLVDAGFFPTIFPLISSIERVGDVISLRKATFLSKNEIQVADRRLRFRKAVIATGGRAKVPPIPGLEHLGF